MSNARCIYSDACARKEESRFGDVKNLARALTFFSWGSDAGGKNVFFLLDQWGMCICARARDFGKMVGKVEKLPWESLDKWIMWT